MEVIEIEDHGVGAGWVDRGVEAERLDLGDGSWVDVSRGWITRPHEVFEHLLDRVTWQTGRLFQYDHVVEERRLGSGWWRDRGQPVPHPVLAEATRVLQHRYGVTFGGFSMIQYRDGNDGQAFHRDTDMRWLDDTIIAILTFGATRPWQLRPHSVRQTSVTHEPGKGATHDLAPASGDLIVMGGASQRDWEHSVPYLIGRRDVGPRISIQWRHARTTGRPQYGANYRAPQRFHQRQGRYR